MRIAVLADIHGHLPALDAVLREVEATGVDTIVLNGDMATGPMPAQTLDRLADLGDRARWVHGNCERELAAAYDGTLPDDLPDEVRIPTEYCATQLTPAHRALLTELPRSIPLDVPGLGPVRFCHATARSDTEIVLVDSPIARFRAAFSAATEPTVVLGHTHMPFDRLADTRRFVNPGSVGMPYGTTGASWALLTSDGITLRNTPYNVLAAAETFRTQAPDYPALEEFIEENMRTTPSDAQALTVFTQAADRETPADA